MSDMPIVEIFSFSIIIPDRDASVRLVDKAWFVAVDLAMVMSGKNKDDAGKDVRGLTDDLFPLNNYKIQTLPGQGNKNIRLVNFKNAITLIMVLPGKTAKTFRGQFAEVIINAFKIGSQSTGVFAQMASAGSNIQVISCFMSNV